MNIRAVALDFFANESVVVSSTSKALTAATYQPAATVPSLGPATYALVTVEADQIRWWADGSDPTDLVGHRANVDDVIELVGAASIRNFRAIRITTDATLRCSYARKNPSQG